MSEDFADRIEIDWRQPQFGAANSEKPSPGESAFISLPGSRAVWHRGWKAVSRHPSIATTYRAEEDRWELYDTDEDPNESQNLAMEQPTKLRELIDLWYLEAAIQDALPAPRDGHEEITTHE
jgi:arylsulfatase